MWCAAAAVPSVTQDHEESAGLKAYLPRHIAGMLALGVLLAGGAWGDTIIRKELDGLKVLGNGELTKKLTVKAVKFTGSAKEKIEAVGGTAEVI